MSDPQNDEGRSFIESVKMFPEVHAAAADIMDEIGGDGEQAVRDRYNNFVVDLALKLVGNPATDRQAATFMDAWTKSNGATMTKFYSELLEATSTKPKPSSKPDDPTGRKASAAGMPKFRGGSKPTPPPESKKEAYHGRIVSTKWDVRVFSGKESRTAKMLVESDTGFKVWGTIPKPLRDVCGGKIEDLVGAEVMVKAELVSGKDPADKGFKIAKWPELISYKWEKGSS